MNLTSLQLPFLIQDLFNHAHFPVSLLGISHQLIFVWIQHLPNVRGVSWKCWEWFMGGFLMGSQGPTLQVGTLDQGLGRSIRNLLAVRALQYLWIKWAWGSHVMGGVCVNIDNKCTNMYWCCNLRVSTRCLAALLWKSDWWRLFKSASTDYYITDVSVPLTYFLFKII